MVPSAVMNEAIVFFTALALRALVQRTPREKLPESFRFFTVLSNLFCAFTALLLLLCELFGAMPAWAATLKYMGTAAVTVTLVTVFVYLLPATGSLKGLLDSWPELIMHLITPLLAILSFLFFENEGLSAWIIPLGVLPVILYGLLYFNRVVVARTWEDMYGFNKSGKWRQSFALMLLGTVIIAVLLWWL
jgi:hypothetical protein